MGPGKRSHKTNEQEDKQYFFSIEFWIIAIPFKANPALLAPNYMNKTEVESTPKSMKMRKNPHI
jgi:hypothetical protein